MNAGFSNPCATIWLLPKMRESSRSSCPTRRISCEVPLVSHQFVRSVLRSVAARVCFASSIDSLSQLTGKALILTYHRVIPPSELETTFVQPGMYVTPETFARHLQFLTSHFNVVSLQDLLANWRNNT